MNDGAAAARWLVARACAVAAGPGAPSATALPRAGLGRVPAGTAAQRRRPKTVARGAAVAGDIQVACGFGAGSYTVTLHAADGAETFTPKTFIVNFGLLADPGTFTVRFATAAIQRVEATGTPNRGSPAVHGHVVAAISGLAVALR